MRRGSLVVSVVVVVAAGVAGAAAGSVAARSIGSVSGASAATTESASPEPVGPDGTPPMADGFPNATEPYMPDVTFKGLEQAWLQMHPDWQCETAAGTIGDSTSCTSSDPSEQYQINVDIVSTSEDPERDLSVRATCVFDGPGAPGHSRCKSHYADVSDLVFAKDQSVRKQARQWVRRNAVEDKSTVIGGIRITNQVELDITFESEFSPY
jgi:hypothetical protein